MTLTLLALLACADKDPKETGETEETGETSETEETGETGETEETGDSGPSFDCPERASGLQQVTTTPASPYYVQHPTAEPDGESGHIVVFLAGGPSDGGSANYAFSAFLARAAEVEQVWAVMPYTEDGSLSDEGERVVAVVDEILDCYGGDASRVHLAGTSNGGRAAYSIMLERSDRFATLLGAPGYFTEADTSVWADALADRAVFNGVGGEDSEDWQAVVEETHDTLVSLGVDSTYEVFEGQGHIPDESFDPSILFDFWLSHGG